MPRVYAGRREGRLLLRPESTGDSGPSSDAAHDLQTLHAGSEQGLAASLPAFVRRELEHY
jgi:hypothetical protein